MQKDFITATPDNGSSDTTVTVVASENTGSARSSSIAVSGGGMTRTVSVSQEEAVIGWKYYFYVQPDSFSFPAEGGTKYAQIDSYKVKTINGKETSERVNVGYTSSASGDSTFSVDGLVIDCEPNSDTNTKSGSVSFIQEESGKRGDILLYQDASKEREYNINLHVNVDVPFTYNGFQIWGEAEWNKYVIRNVNNPIENIDNSNAFECVSDSAPILQHFNFEEVIVIDEYGENTYCQAEYLYDDMSEPPLVTINIFE